MIPEVPALHIAEYLRDKGCSVFGYDVAVEDEKLLSHGIIPLDHEEPSIVMHC